MRVDAQGAQNLVTGSSRRGTFLVELEDYYDKLKKGQPTLSSPVPEELGRRLSSSTEILSNTDPSNLKKYNGYLTAFNYDRRARFVANLGDSFELTNKIVNIRA